MKILYISAEPIRSGQASATHINEIANGLIRAGHEVTMSIAPAMGPYDRTSLVRRYAAYLVFCFQALRRMRRATLIYARAHPAHFMIAAVAWAMQIPIVHEINGPYQDISITHPALLRAMRLVRALYRFQYARASALIAVTSGLAEWARGEAPGVPVHAIANGSNCEIFNPARPPVRAVARDYALFFGSLARWHGVETMIAAAQNVAWPPDLDLVIIGDGQLSEMVRQVSAENAHIHALESVPQETLARYINAAVVGLVPINSVGGRGKYGMSPLKLYEMLACGLPVVVTDFPGQAELVRSLDAGLVVSPDDPVELARAVAALREKLPSRDRMLRVASTVKAEHSWNNRLAEISKVLDGVMDHARAHRSV